MNPPVISALGFRSVNRRLFASVSLYLHAQNVLLLLLLYCYLERFSSLFNKQQISHHKN
jgi:hypothetical protein